MILLLKKSLLRGIFSLAIVGTTLALSAGYSDLSYSNNYIYSGHCTDSYNDNDTLLPDTLSYGSRALQGLCNFFNSGAKATQKQAWKGLAIFLALQNRAEAIITANGLSYNMSYTPGIPLRLLPITNISGYEPHPCCFVTINTGGNGGIISSTISGFNQSFDGRTWRVQGDSIEILPVLANIVYTPDNVTRAGIGMNARITTLDQLVDSPVGLIALKPFINSSTTTTNSSPATQSLATTATPIATPTNTVTTISNIAITSLTNQSSSLNTNTETSSTQTAPSLGSTSSLDIMPKTSDESQKATTSPISETLPMLLVSSTNSPPYASIGGGAAAGAVFLAGTIAGALVYRRAKAKKGPNQQAQDEELAIPPQQGSVIYDKVLPDHVGNQPQYAKVVVGRPGAYDSAKAANEYERASSAFTMGDDAAPVAQPPVNSAYAQLPVQKSSQYDATDSALT